MRVLEVHSVGPTLAVVASLAFVLAAQSAISGGMAANKAANEIRTKGKRLVSELGALQGAQNAIKAALAEPAPKDGPAAARHVEEVAARIEEFATAIRRTLQAVQLLETAIRDGMKSSSFFERVFPGWREASSKALEAAATLRAELTEGELGEALRSASVPLGQMLALSMAEAGLHEWAAALPVEDEPLVDEDEGEPIRWDMDAGWIGR